jgi:hypothetical protein
MDLDKPKTLYHYCSLDTFLNIIKSSSIWMSDVQKSNDSGELKWFRQQFYDYIFDKYNGTDDENIREICQIVFTIAAKDGFEKCPTWLLPAVNDNSQQLADLFNSLRVYAFCLSELNDSLGQWRGYANDGNGVSIGFSREYLDNIWGRGLRCPYFNFLLGDISYRHDLTSLFEKVFNLYDKNKVSEFVLNIMTDLTHASAMFKHPSFYEEKEWRIIYLMNDYAATEEGLNFAKFDALSTLEYKKHFDVPKIEYVAREKDIIPHMEIKIKNLSEAIDSIVIGPKSSVTERDIRHILLRFGVIQSFDDSSIEIINSSSSYR